MAKNFKKITNPAMQFITTEDNNASADTANNTQHTQQTQPAQHTQQTQQTQRTAKNGDLKGKRFNLLFYSTDTLEDLKILAKLEDTDSVNALINKILTEYAAAHADSIKKYNDLLNK